ncbi:hypothetical protein M3621_13790 [Bacillus safensis]|uniref:hypothetical protein n=1 Tax=Bacillus safensis TaxID=561879 RepID=UPI002040EE55|nr:hypothetical protein [Bacillus safensis]MCM3367872.1 hypothetical protein [Bacillus safensis]
MQLNKVGASIKVIMLFLVNNLHTLFFLCGLAFFLLVAYMQSLTIGFIASGAILILIAILINPKEERR